MTIHGPAVFIRKKGAGFANRVGGYQLSKKVWTCLACRAWHDPPKPKRCQVCDHAAFLYYDSAGEARYFIGLMRAQDAGQLTDLQHHPRYSLHCFGVDGIIEVMGYTADAEFVDRGELVTADYKPKSAEGLDPVFKLKQRWFQAEYGRNIRVVTEE